MNPFGQTAFLDGASDQFRLARIQTFNWGTFSQVFDFPIPKEGYLFVGPSGSGKSTILDAHAALLTPPKWVDFNVAAREAERNGRDRSVMTYVRGAWAQQTQGGEYVSQYLRTGTTWSAIAETYRNDQGRVVVLAEVLWVRGNSTAPGDVKRLYLTLEEPLDIQQLEFFAKSEFEVRRFKHDLAAASVHHEFSAYQERFRRLLGIDSERALRLLHKTQSAKNLGDLNAFLRDFMLDEPQTFDIATRLVNEFGELNDAHKAVVAARNQIQVLTPARDEHLALDKGAFQRNGLLALQGAVDVYREHRRKALLDERIAQLGVELEGSRQEGERLAALVSVELEKLTDLQRQKVDLGAGVLDRIRTDIERGEREKPERIRKRDHAARACKTMEWSLPDEVVTFVQRVESATQRVLKSGELKAQADERKFELRDQHRRTSEEFTATVAEVRALQRQKSNLPVKLLDLRAEMARDLGIPEEKLPFVGELIEVRPDESAWQGAIERVLGGFARSILVEDKSYPAVSAYLNDRHIGDRLVYFRTLSQSANHRTPGPKSLYRKLKVAEGTYADWVRDELRTHFDVECADTMAEFKAAPRAVMQSGLVKHNTTRHEKNDRHQVNDRSRWVLGFDNKAKRALFEEKAATLGVSIAEIERQQAAASLEEDLQQRQMLACQTLSNLSWNDIDVASLLTWIDDLNKRLDAELKARPDLAVVDERITAQEGVYQGALNRKNDEAAKASGLSRDLSAFNDKLASLASLWPTADREQPFAQALGERYAATNKPLTLDNIDSVTTQVDRGLSAELRQLDTDLTNLRNSIIGRFAEFNRQWPAESDGLDASLESAEDYFGKLQRLINDNLPKYEDRFFALLREQSDQNLTLLATKLDQERSAIKSRMDLVNESLETAPFGQNTHLVIETKDKTLDDVRAFRADLKAALSHSFSTEREVAEQRFKALALLVKHLGSQETADKNWRTVVLDVRQHVEFVARELDADGIEQEVYQSGAGKSGGQRQKLAATCLAAALRYQLGGQDRALPAFSTVVLDEAFDKADAEFTAMAMNIFKTFGFQMIVATPLKSVMTLEPFIGGACFVHIKDRKKSAIIPIEYDSEQHRLKLSPELQHAEEASAS